MWEKIKNFYAYGFLVATSGWILAHLILTKLYGAVLISEPNQGLLWTDIGLVSLMLLLGVERFINALRNHS